MLQTSASLVVYQTPAAELRQLLQTLQSSVDVWVVIDNSADQVRAAQERKRVTEAYGGIYVATPTNTGSGGGHNLGLFYLQDAGYETRYHLMVNPDIEFDPSVPSVLAKVLNERSDVGWVMPQVRSEDGSVQPLCKLLPTPIDLVGRRFLPAFLQRAFGLSQEDYELKGIADLASEHVPFLSGCFIFARFDLLQKAKGFDDRYFMYMEDVDLSRRFRQFGKLLYWPEVHVTHGHKRGSYHDLWLTLTHVRSAVLYFQRWGWFSDPERKARNAQALRSLRNEIRFAHSAERSRAEAIVEPHHWDTRRG